MKALLEWLFAPAPDCNALCREVREELEAMHLSARLAALAAQARR